MTALIKTSTMQMFKWVNTPEINGYLGWLTGLILIIGFACPSLVLAQGDLPVLIETKQAKYLTGKKLQNPKALSFWWKDAQLRDRLMAFSDAENIAVMLDRRVDPSTIVNLGIENKTVEQIFWRVGSAAKIGVCRIEDCYYFGPVDTIVELPIAMETLSRQAKKVKSRSKVKWTVKRQVRTGTVVATKSLIEAIATKHGFTVNGLEKLPHDLWYSVSLPPTSVLAQMQLMLAGFNKTFEIAPDAKSITIIDFPQTESARRTFIVAKKPANSKDLAKQFPDLKISFRSTAVTAKGPPQQLAKFAAALVEQVVPKTGKAELHRFTLNTEADRLTILRTIADTAKLELVLGEIPPAELSDRIKLNVTKVTQGELIFETLKGTRFRAVVEKDKLVVKQ